MSAFMGSFDERKRMERRKEELPILIEKHKIEIKELQLTLKWLEDELYRLKEV